MAKSSKKSFKESVADYAALSERIGRRQFAPVYLLMGEEPYFIDMLAERLGETILSPEERAFTRRSFTAGIPKPGRSSIFAVRCR